MTTDLNDLRRRLVAARRALDFAWATWSGMAMPTAVRLRARIAVGLDWLAEHPAPEDQARGKALIAQLRAQAHNAELEEAEPGQAQNIRRAWDAAESRFLAAEHEYLRLVSDANRLGIPEPVDGE